MGTALGQKLLVQWLFGQFIEVRMADVMSGDAAALVPRLFEGQGTQHMIDPAAHLVHAPSRPPPKLRRHEIVDRDAMKVSPPGQPPVEPRVIDQNDRGRTLVPEVTGATGQQL